MNKKPKPHPTQKIGLYMGATDGGSFDIGVAHLQPGVGLYHEQQLEEMRIAERVYFFPYLLSVLAAIGHQRENEQ